MTKTRSFTTWDLISQGYKVAMLTILIISKVQLFSNLQKNHTNAESCIVCPAGVARLDKRMTSNRTNLEYQYEKRY